MLLSNSKEKEIKTGTMSINIFASSDIDYTRLKGQTMSHLFI